MRMYRFRRRHPYGCRLGVSGVLFLVLILHCFRVNSLLAQTVDQTSLQQQIQNLIEAMTRTQTQLEQSQHQLDEMRQQLTALQREIANSGSSTSPLSSTRTQEASSAAPVNTAEAIEDIQERQAMQASQIATHEQTKVESESKFPVKITGLLLLNTFVNTSAVDVAATPTLAIPGGGSTGASVRQTVLGFDARGPQLFGARSYADLRVDFDGNSQSDSQVAGYSGYYGTSSMILRLRTAHAFLEWDRTKAYFSLDRPIFSPDVPTSLTAVSVPPLAWSGNLWTWNPQAGVTQNLRLAGSRSLQLEAALVDVSDAPLTPSISPSMTESQASIANSAEQSRWPGVETHIALLGSGEQASSFGAGGYFAPHRSALGHSFDSWAGTLDSRLALSTHFELTASAYRGMALGGLGGGAYKDFAYRADPESGVYYIRPLDDVGGWMQLKEKFSEQIQMNQAFGLDNVFAGELRRYAVPGGSMYMNLARNRTYTSNIIYSPSAYLLFSLEYRHLTSSPVTGLPADSNVIGLGAGYKF